MNALGRAWVSTLTATLKDFTEDDRAPAAAEPLDFDEIYTQHFEFACRSLRLLGVEVDALEDAAQDVFGVVARRLGDFEQSASVTTWLFAIVQRVAANHRRTRRRKRDRLEPLRDPPLAAEQGPDAHADAARAAHLIQVFAAALDEERRAVLVLGVLERVPVRELADSLGVPLFTVYSRIRSVRDALKAFLTEHEVGT
jgi:RNA polymerase sigma-70 factor, ECF subfamily